MRDRAWLELILGVRIFIILRICQELFGSGEKMAVGGSKDAIVAHLVETLREDVLEKPADKFLGWKGHGLPGHFAGIFVAEAYLSIFYGENAAVADGYPVDVASKIVEDLCGSLETGFTVDHPRLLPDRVWETKLRQCLGGKFDEFCAED